MSAAAITATKLVVAFRPKLLAMIGITAGVRGQVELGDVLVAEQCWDWGMGKWMRSQKDGVLAFHPAPHQLSLDAELRSRLAAFSQDEMELARIRADWPADAPATALQLRLGPIASGAAVIAAQQMTDHVQAQHRKLIGIDMEAYSIFASADEARLPKPRALVIKGVSDFADEQKSDTWQRYAAYASAKILAHYVSQ